ncbi:MAG: UDP-N-acetylglucosamine 1-carboxyvinyltransferase [Candidatus Paceibacterota bacterium]|jgi:UDP-N-acetylglucosamine 1-carboxyvinyltransferase
MKNKSAILEIEGIGQEKSLKGSIKINGAKNAALKAMAAAILFDGPVTLNNIPDNEDVKTMSDILSKLGAKVINDGKHCLKIDTSKIHSTAIDPKLASSMRASIVLSGPMLGRFGKLTFPAPGGCVIGSRPIDLFIDGYEKLGASTTETECIYEMNAPKGLTGSEITFKKISVGATETLMMAAVMAKGTTTLNNCAKEPEIVNVADWLNACGAKIMGQGTSTITIEGNAGRLLTPKVPYTAIPDRIEAGSYLLLGAMLASDIRIENCRPDHLGAVIDLLRKSGVEIKTGDGFVHIVNNKPNKNYVSVDIETREYPGFPTDLQAQAVTFLTQVTGTSTVTETIFEGRFKYVQDLISLGARIDQVSAHEIKVHGPTPFTLSPLDQIFKAHDIRAGFALIMALIAGKGKYSIKDIHLVDRGYEHIENRLKELGVNVKRV